MRYPILPVLACLAAGCCCCSLQAQRPSGHAEGAGRSEAAPGPGGRSATVPGRSGGPRGGDLGAVRIPGFATIARPGNLPAPMWDRVFIPGALPRCGAFPDSAYWQSRDILREIMLMARRGFIPVEPGGEVPEFKGYAWFPAGWRAYGFVVPGGEKLHVRLYHPNEGWFRLVMVDRWGQVREGMLQNLIPTGNPEVTYKSPLKVATTVYVIVDDPGWWSTKGNPYTIKVDRTWDPAKAKAPDLPPVMGIWAQTKTPAPAPEKSKDAKPTPTA